MPARRNGDNDYLVTGSRLAAMGGWYWIGVASGIGVGIGIALGSLLPEGRTGLSAGVAALLGVAAGIGIGHLVGGWAEAAGGGSGGLLGAVSSVPIVAGALRGGGTRLGVAAIVALTGLAAAALGFIPGLGYLEAVAAPALALRLRRRGGQRYAGLRILAKD
jgi:hypothetical protein